MIIKDKTGFITNGGDSKILVDSLEIVEALIINLRVGFALKQENKKIILTTDSMIEYNEILKRDKRNSRKLKLILQKLNLVLIRIPRVHFEFVKNFFNLIIDWMTFYYKKEMCFFTNCASHHIF